MKENNRWLIMGLMVVLGLLAAIAGVFFWKQKMSFKKTVEAPLITNLNEVFSDTELYTEITAEDIRSGRLLRSEMAKATPFSEDTIPFKFNRKDVGLYDSTLVWDEEVYKSIKNNPEKSPFRNLYFYKLAYGDIWLTILGQQVKNSDGTSAFMHYLIGADKDIYQWGTNSFGVTPKLRVFYTHFDYLKVPASFFGIYGDYYNREGIVEDWYASWQETGIVPQDLQRAILLMVYKE